MTRDEVKRANVLQIALDDWRDLRKRPSRYATADDQHGLKLGVGQVSEGTWGTNDPILHSTGYIVVDMETGAKILTAAKEIIKIELKKLGVIQRRKRKRTR